MRSLRSILAQATTTKASWLISIVRQVVSRPAVNLRFMDWIGKLSSKGLEVFTDVDRPWRKRFLVYRAVGTLGRRITFLNGLSDFALRRIEALLNDNPDMLLPTHQYFKSHDQKLPSRFSSSELLEVETQSAGWMLNLAKVEYASGRFSTGDRALELAKDAAPDFIDVYEEEALNQRWRGNTFRSIRASTDCIRLSKTPAKKVKWLAFRAKEFYELGDLDAALADFLSAFELRPDQNLAYRIGEIYERRGDRRKSLHFYSSALEGSRGMQMMEPEIYDSIVSLHVEKNNWASAIHAHELTPVHDHDDRTDRFVEALVNVGDTERIIRENETRPFASVDSLRHLGDAYFSSGEWQKASEVYTRILSSNDSEWTLSRSRFRLARCAHELQQSESASAQFAEAHQYSMQEARKRLTRREQSKIKTLPDLELLDRLIDKSETIEEIRIAAALKGDTLRRLGKPDEACTAYELMFGDEDFPEPVEDLNSSQENYFREKFYAATLTRQPVREKTILFESFHGASTTCNPLAISLRMLNDPRFADWTQVWAVKSLSSIDPRLLGHDNVRFTSYSSYGYLYHLATSQTLVNNNTFMPYFVRREGQFYVNTWHGTPLKSLGKNVQAQPGAYGNATRNFLQASLIALPNQFTADSVSESYELTGLVPGKVEVLGSPRLDTPLAMDAAYRIKLVASLNLEPDEPWLLYAPTWRGTFDAVQDPLADIRRVVEISERLGVPVRVSPHHLQRQMLMSSSMQHVLLPESSNINDILGLHPVVISDFSSILADAAIVGCKTFSFAPDLTEYRAKQGLELDPQAVGAQIMESPERLELSLRDYLSSRRGESQIPEQFSAYEDGLASMRVLDRIFESSTEPSVAADDDRSFRLLLSVSGLIPNGITSSLRNLVETLSTLRPNLEVWLAIPQSVLQGPEYYETIKDLRRCARIIPTSQANVTTFREQASVNRLLRKDTRQMESEVDIKLATLAMSREFSRLFGTATFHAVVEFNGYSSRRSMLFGLGTLEKSSRTVHFLHNDILQEATTRFSFLHASMRSLKHYDALVSVSDSLRERHRSVLNDYGVMQEHNLTVDNSLDFDRILSLSEEPLDQLVGSLLAKERTLVTVPARLSPEKNHATLFDAFANHLKEKPDSKLELLLLGAGPELRALRSQAESLRLENRIHFMGHLNNPYPVMRNSHFVLLPSLYEGQGLVLLEALVVGTPVYATDIPGPRSVLKNGQYGRLVSTNAHGLQAALDEMTSPEPWVAGEMFDPVAYSRSALNQFLGAVGFKIT